MQVDAATSCRLAPAGHCSLQESGADSQSAFVGCVSRARSPVPAAGFEPAAFRFSSGRSYRLSYTGISETPAGVEPASFGLQPIAWPSGPGVLKCRRCSTGRAPPVSVSIPVRSRTSPSTFARSRATGTLRGRLAIPRPGIEPGPALSKRAMISVSPPGQKIRGLGSNQHPRVQSPPSYP